MTLYSIQRTLKAIFFSGYQKWAPGKGLSRYLPGVKMIGEWLAMPPRSPKGRPAKIEVDSARFEIFLSEKDPTISPRIYAHHIWEKNESLVFARVIKPGMVILDLGAHFGYYSLLAAKLCGPAGRVVSFEPDPFNFELFKKNIQHNQLSKTVTAIHKAVGDANRETFLYGSSEGDSSDRTLFKTGKSGVAYKIESVRVEDYLRVHFANVIDKIQVVKMDIEGYETHALRGMETLLNRSDVVLFVEINYQRLREAGSSAGQFLGKLADYGFRFYLIDPHEKDEQLILKHKTIESLTPEQEFHVDLFCCKGDLT